MINIRNFKLDSYGEVFIDFTDSGRNVTDVILYLSPDAYGDPEKRISLNNYLIPGNVEQVFSYVIDRDTEIGRSILLNNFIIFLDVYIDGYIKKTAIAYNFAKIYKLQSNLLNKTIELNEHGFDSNAIRKPDDYAVTLDLLVNTIKNLLSIGKIQEAKVLWEKLRLMYLNNICNENNISGTACGCS